MSTLTNSDKISIVEQKIKNLEYQQYSSTLDLQLENAAASPDQDNIDSINAKLSDIAAKLNILNAEKNNLTE
ncbi:MAG: hypothetical protein EB150_04840 [Nitrososphaeria archaeon]|jgi:hypothetical protein|nr:hypothetical protein [Nitrososphaeria archaeon]